MGFIGKEPTPVPLTSSDITDGIITGAKIETNPTISGNLTVSGTTTLADNIVFSGSNKGVHLGVTSATASNLIDDYEEGTFTPTWNGYSTLSSTSGKYVKIGDHVTVYIKLVTGTSNDSSAVGVNNLPFTITGDLGGGSVYHNQVNLRDQHIVTAFNSNSTSCYLYGETGGSDSTVRYAGTNPQLGQSSSLVWVLHYQTL